MSINFTEEDKQFFLKAVRETIYAYLTGNDIPVYYKTKSSYQEKPGLFIKSTISNEVRAYGCILDAKKNLIENLQDCAIYSHFKDTRFKTITKEDYENLKINIGIITSKESVGDKKLLKPAEHGYLFEYKWLQAVLLPWDIPNTGMTTQEYIKEVSLKAGITNFNNSKITRLYLTLFGEDDYNKKK